MSLTIHTVSTCETPRGTRHRPTLPCSLEVVVTCHTKRLLTCDEKLGDIDCYNERTIEETEQNGQADHSRKDHFVSWYPSVLELLHVQSILL